MNCRKTQDGVDMEPKTCCKCGNSDFDIGWMLSTGRIAFKSDLLNYSLEGGNVRSYVCLQCGYVESFVQEGYLKQIII